LQLVPVASNYQTAPFWSRASVQVSDKSFLYKFLERVSPLLAYQCWWRFRMRTYWIRWWCSILCYERILWPQRTTPRSRCVCRHKRGNKTVDQSSAKTHRFQTRI